MKCKLYPNIRRMTNIFCAGIACVTLSILALRLTVFSDIASGALPGSSDSSAGTSSEQTGNGYTYNSQVYFSSANAAGDVLVTNLEGNRYVINVDVTLAISGKSIMTTGYIMPGTTRETGRLNPVGQALENGVYECIAEFTAHDPDTYRPLGSEKESVKIYIGEKPDKDE